MVTPSAETDDVRLSNAFNDASPDGTQIGPDGKPVPKKKPQQSLSFDQLDPSQQGLAMLFFFLALLLDPKMLEGSGLDKVFGSILGLDPNKGETFGKWQENALKSGKSAPELAKGHNYKNFNFGEAALLAASDTPILELIGKHESGGDYNNYYGRNKKGENVDFSKMSIDQVLAWQHHHTKSDGFASSAAGKYQTIEKTLRACKQEMGLSGNEKFDPAMQDKIAVHLLNKRGYQDFLKGEIGADQFARNLSKEWASLPKDASGLSYYHGDGLNKAGVGWGTVLSAVQASRNAVRSPAFDAQVAAKGGPLVLNAPLNSQVTSHFGHRDTGIAGASHDHGGIDMRASIGTPLLAQGPVQVAYAGPSSGYGNVAILNHGQGVFTVYGHIESDGMAKTGTVLQKGQMFAKSGNEGVGNAPHLHSETLLQGEDGRVYNVDPEKAIGQNLADPKIREALIADAGYKTSRVFTARVDRSLQGDPAFLAEQRQPQKTAPAPASPAVAEAKPAATEPSKAPVVAAKEPPAVAATASKPASKSEGATSFATTAAELIWGKQQVDTVRGWFQKAADDTRIATAENTPAAAKTATAEAKAGAEKPAAAETTPKTADTSTPAAKKPDEETHPAIAAAKNAPAAPAPA